MKYELDGRLSALYEKIEELEQKEQWLALVSVYQECIRISLDVYGEYHEETLALYTEYGGLLRNLGRYEESLSILNKALRCTRKIKGTGHPDYAAALVNLANLLRMMRYDRESESLFLKAKAIYEAVGGTEWFVYAGLCNNLGLLYQQMNRHAEAIPLHKKSLSILQDDPEHEVLYGVTLNNLVEPYKAEGKREQAIEYLKKALEIFRKHMSHASVLYAAAMNNLGAIYYEQKEYKKALDCFARALAISREKLGTDSESYKHSLTNYEQTARRLQLAAEPQAASQALPVITEDSSGLAIAEGYFYEVCYPVLEKQFSEWLPRMAAGLVGEGSECYGFDDRISRDHDFGPSFQIFIPKEDMDVYGKALIDMVDSLPKSYRGFKARNVSAYGDGRVGVLAIEDFYDKYLSMHRVPDSNRLWLQMEDIPLSTATNGKVFLDNLGQFSQLRNELLAHYPKDVCLKRMAAECMQIAQSGQYNLPRSLQREEYVSAVHALDQFISHYSSFIYLINKTYRPYYKWEHRGLKKLPVLGVYAHRELEKLALVPLKEKPKYALFIVEGLCGKLIEYMKNKQLSTSRSDFLLDHGPELMKRISDEALRLSNPWEIRI